MEELRLTLKGKEIRVVLEMPDGTDAIFFLRELTGKTRDEFITHVAGKMKYDSKGLPMGVRTFDGLQASLLTKTLFDEGGEGVGFERIQAFPASTISALFDKSQELSALNEESVEQVKND